MAHMLEERGLPTTVLALVLPQVEKTRPPRAVMTPFMLGRPLGEPNDVAFQGRVLMQALGLLERSDGPVILEHFSDDNPSWFDRPDWIPAVSLPSPGVYQGSAAWEAAIARLTIWRVPSLTAEALTVSEYSSPENAPG